MLRRLSLELNNVADVLELGFGKAVAFTTESAQDVTTLLFAANLDEPAGGFRHAEDDDGKEEQGHDLEGDGETPDKVGVGDGVEGCATGEGLISITVFVW